jgi:hypothetical protein
LWVDKGKLRECAGIVDACAAPPGRALAEAAGDLVTAMRGLAQGLEQAANRFHTVDVDLGRAADGGNGPR